MKVAVGISGGIDSLVTALRLQAAGHEVIGATMTLGRADEADSLAAAKSAAAALGIELAVCDLTALWQREVAGYLRTSYLAARTPNPCIRCNELIKFGAFPRWCFETLGVERFATGHYARLDLVAGRPQLRRGRDLIKDQSYFLYRVAPEILARTLLPLGELTKAEVRALGREAGFAQAEAGDSQDFCGGEVRDFLALAPRSGNIVTADGKVLGQHQGYWNYTVGKRRGLGIGGGTPYYVLRLDAVRNEVVVGFKAETLTRELHLTDTVGRIDFSLPVKVRSAGEPRLLSEGLTGVAPGQSAVFYDGDTVVGGGIIA